MIYCLFCLIYTSLNFILLLFYIITLKYIYTPTQTQHKSLPKKLNEKAINFIIIIIINFFFIIKFLIMKILL